jgi:hypothetical protein
MMRSRARRQNKARGHIFCTRLAAKTMRQRLPPFPQENCWPNLWIVSKEVPMVSFLQFVSVALIFLNDPAFVSAFSIQTVSLKIMIQRHELALPSSSRRTSLSHLEMSDPKRESANLEGVIELPDDTEENDKTKAVAAASPVQAERSSAAPFLSQGDIDIDALNPDLTDPKQARVIIYILISLLPVLFLIPLMLGSRDLIPLDAFPPVEM